MATILHVASTNNGLPVGLHFKRIHAGDVVFVSIGQHRVEQPVLISESFMQHRPVTYKGVVTYRGLISADGTNVKEVVIKGEQIKRKSSVTLFELFASSKQS